MMCELIFKNYLWQYDLLEPHTLRPGYDIKLHPVTNAWTLCFGNLGF